MYALNKNLNSEFVLDFIIKFVFRGLLTLNNGVINEYFVFILSNNLNKLGQYIKSKWIKTILEFNDDVKEIMLLIMMIIFVKKY